MKKQIHVNRQVLARNRKLHESNPPITVKTYKDNRYCNEADILDDNGKVIATIIYRPQKPLSCGAVAWIETEQEVVCR